jgi:hypothetical protein
VDAVSAKALAKDLSREVRAAAARLSDALAAISWRRFLLWVFLSFVLIGALPNWFIFGVIKDLLPAATLFCALLKAQAGSRREAARGRDEALREAGAANAKALAFEARLDPHFLFNAMATVEHLIGSDPAAATRAQRALSVYLRSGLGTPHADTVGSQSKACEAYLEIQTIRMGSRLEWSAQWSSFEQPMPGRVAIGALETAVALCVEPSVHGGRVDLACGVDPADPARLIWTMSCPAEGIEDSRVEPWRRAWMASTRSPSWTESRAGERWTVSMGWRPAQESVAARA